MSDGRYCPECGTEIAPTGWGCHHSASCTLSGENFNDRPELLPNLPGKSAPAPREEVSQISFWMTKCQQAEASHEGKA